MRASVLLIVAAAGLLIGACSSSPDVRGSGPEAVGTAGTPTKSRWSPYLQVMTDKERIEFLGIDDTFDREQWIRRNGIDVRADLDRRLSRGLSLAAAKNRIDAPLDETSERGDTTMLFYSRFNTESSTNFWLMFQNDQLVSWDSYPVEDQRREREILDFEARLMNKFNTVLKRGIGMAEIKIQAANAQENLNRVRLAHREDAPDPDFKGRAEIKVDMSDYLVAEALLYAETQNELFAWFQGREADHIIVHRPFETHQYFMTYTDLWGNETEIIVEFVFRSGALENWFIYHEK
jgi:hypothetical protein